MHLARKERPSLWTWMQKPRNAWVHYILAIHKGKEGHWVLIKGVKLCDTYIGGHAGSSCATAPTRAPHHGGVRGAEGAGGVGRHRRQPYCAAGNGG